jgi:adenylate kinase
MRFPSTSVSGFFYIIAFLAAFAVEEARGESSSSISTFSATAVTAAAAPLERRVSSSSSAISFLRQNKHQLKNVFQVRGGNITNNSSSSRRNGVGVSVKLSAATASPSASSSVSPVTISTARKSLKIIIAGAPASGKGTQCEIIKQNFGLVHLSTGDMLRAAVQAKTEVGLKAKEFMDAGKLVTDDIIIGVVKERLSHKDCQEKGWLLDGFPRTKAQADALSSAHINADCFLFLNVPDEALIERVVGRRSDPETGKIYHMKFSPPEDSNIGARLTQRSDDTEEKVKVRLEAFHEHVNSVKGCYTDIAVEINGLAHPGKVSEAISNALADVLLSSNSSSASS